MPRHFAKLVHYVKSLVCTILCQFNYTKDRKFSLWRGCCVYFLEILVPLRRDGYLKHLSSESQVSTQFLITSSSPAGEQTLKLIGMYQKHE